MDVETDCTVLAAISNFGSWADGCYIVAEEKGKNFLGGISGICDGAIWASGTGIGEFANINVVGIWEHWWSRSSWGCKT